MILFAATTLGWPERLVSENHTGTVPSGHVVFATWADVDAWKAVNEDKRPGSNTAPVPNDVPDEVELWKLRTILDQMGYTQAINTFIDNQPEPPRIMLRNAFEYIATPIRRDSVFVHEIAAGVGIAERIDEIFRAAGRLDVP